MNILIATRSLPEHQLGGMEYYAKDTAIYLAKLGHKICLLTTELADDKTTHYNLPNLKLVTLKGTKPGAYSKAWWSKSQEYYLQNGKEFQVIISVSIAAQSIAMLHMRCPVLMQCHGTARGEVAAKWQSGSLWNIAKSLKNIYHVIRAKRDYSWFDHFVAVGDRVEQDLTRWPLNLSKTSVTLIRNGVKVPNQILAPSNTTKKVIALSRLHEQKGIQHAIAAFKLPALKTMELHIAGSGPYERELKKLAANAHNIKFIGQIAREHVSKTLQQYDAFVFTSTHVEGYPLNLLEAMAAGLPIVASKHLTSALPKANSVFSVDPTNADEVAQNLRRAIIAPRNQLPNDYAIEHVMQKYINLCEQLWQK